MRKVSLLAGVLTLTLAAWLVQPQPQMLAQTVVRPPDGSASFNGVLLDAASGDSITDTTNDALRVNIVAGAVGGAGGTSAADDADFTDGTSLGTAAGGVAEVAAPSTVTEGDFGWFAMTLNRALKTSLYAVDGTSALGVAGTAAAPTLTVQGIASMTPVLTMPGTAATWGIHAEDSAHSSTQVGLQVFGVYQSSQVDFGADGDYVPFSIDDAGGLRVSIVAGAGSGGTAAADDADFTDGTTQGTPIGGVAENASPTTVTEGDFGWAAITLNRALKVTLYSAAGTELTVATDVVEDVAETAGGSGPMVMSVRRDTAASSAGTTGDNATFNTDATGRLWTSGANLEDVASAGGDQGLVMFAIRDDTLDARSGTEGDFEYLHTNANGAVWAIDVNSAAKLTALNLLGDAVFVDDAAFIPGTSKGFAVGFQADDTSSDPVDEGDFGVPRMSLDRLVYTRQLDPCSGKAKTYYVVDVADGTNTEIANAVSGEYFYICSVNLVAAGATTVLISEDDTDGCGSPSAGLHGGSTGTTTEGWGFAANGGISLGGGGASVMKTATSNRYLCIDQSASVQLSGTIVYASAP